MTGNTLFEELNLKREQTRTRQKKLAPLPTPSVYQQAVLDAITGGTKGLFVGATAGAGKTKLLQMIAQTITERDMLPPGEIALFCAYNVHIKKTLQKVIPKQFEIKTINGIGDSIIKHHVEKPEFDPRKYEKLITEIVNGSGVQAPAARKELRERLEAVTQLHVGHNLALDIDLSEWADLMNELEAPVVGAEKILHELTLRTLRQGLALLTEHKQLSFLDQTLAPSYFGWKAPQAAKFLLIDEMQDLTRGHLKLLEAVTDENSIVVGVGDRAQSLYGFSGADAQAIEHFKDTFAATELPLSICYRCPSSHVDLARRFTDAIESAPEAEVGVLEETDYDDFLAGAQPGDLVLCRTNVPLVAACYDLIRRGIPAIVRGNDLSKSLVAFAKDTATWDGRRVNRQNLQDDLSLADFMDKLNAYCLTLIERYEKEAEERGTDPGLKIATIADRNEVLNLVLEQGKAQTIADLIHDIRKLFQGKPDESVTLSTIHRAKGLEADNVWILHPELMPHPKAKTPQAEEAERNAIFVAFTRAKKALRLIRTDGEPSGFLKKPSVPQELEEPPFF